MHPRQEQTMQMLDDNHERDIEIIHSAYAERLRDAFKVFAENIGMGQNETACKERFTRSLDLIRKTRDLALEAASGTNVVEPTAEPASGPKGEANAMDLLSSEDKAMIDKMMGETTGAKPPPVSPMNRRY